MKKDNRFWLWGYTLDTVPGSAFYVHGATRCSLETAADYLQVSNVCWMNSLHTMECLNEKQCERLQKYDTVFCGLTHIEHGGEGSGNWELLYKECAAKIAQLSKKFPNIKGAILDDFRSPEGPSKKTSSP